ncbi:glycosyltransferase family 39 protein [Candidatus Parcubacteria bacterium]|nr:glycosyltransferase family 39 protein [Candidatus Parcubacteria bacterium]
MWNKFKKIDWKKISLYISITTLLFYIIVLFYNVFFNNIISFYIEIKYIFAISIISITFYFSQIIKNIPENKREKSKLIKTFSCLFLFSLAIIAINQFLKNEIIINYTFEISCVSIMIGFLTFYANRNRIEKEIEIKKLNEEKIEQKRYEKFYKKFQKINKIWGLRNFIRWIYKEGWGYFLILLFIIFLFTFIKAPYLNTDFSGKHRMKYNAYVEPAKYMAEKNNPFLFQKKYNIDPIDNKQGIFQKFGHLPILEWSLSAVYKILPQTSIEFSTRIVMHFIGILIIIFSYIFLKEIFLKQTSLLISLLIALNPIILFSTFVTIYDSLCIAIMFLSLIYLNIYFKKNNINSLIISGLILGIGISGKYNLALFAIPIYLTFLYYKQTKLYLFLKSSSIFFFSISAPLLISKLSIEILPSNANRGIFLFLISIILIFTLIKKINKYNKKIDKIFYKLSEKKILLAIFFFILISLTIIFLNLLGLKYYFEEFLTDHRLILNFSFYKYMLINQFKEYMTSLIFFFGLIGIINFYNINTRSKILLKSFILGSLIYWILASKIIFFHNYYTIIIMISFCIATSTLLMTFKSRFSKIFLIILICSSSILTFQKTTALLSIRLNGLSEASNYLISHTYEDEIYIDESTVLPLTISTGRGRLGDYSFFDKPSFKLSVRQNGFSETMKKYKIKYLITAKESPDYEKYANIFTDKDLQKTSYRRTDIIFSKLDKNYEYFKDIGERGQIIKEYDIKNKFILEKRIGDYNFFIFQN